jgi:hypothetical protein
MAGQKYSSDPETLSVACYWKNGQRIDLTDGSKTAIARAVFVTDMHVYVAGMMDDQAVYWRDEADRADSGRISVNGELHICQRAGCVRRRS